MSKGRQPAVTLPCAQSTGVFHSNRNYRLPQGLKGAYPPVDMLELRIAVGMLGAFQRLAVGLQAVAQLVQQPIDRPLAHRMAGAAQVLSQPCRAAASPQQRAHRVAPGHRVDQPLQRLHQFRIVGSQRLAAPAGPAQAPPIGVAIRSELVGVEFLQPGADGGTRHAGGGGNAGDAATAHQARLDRRPASAQALVEQRIKGSNSSSR